MRYWLLGLIGSAICAAAAAAAAWCAYAFTRSGLCTPNQEAAECAVSGSGWLIALAALLFLAVPIGSRTFAARRRPRGTGLGVLSWGLAATAAGGAALASALGTAAGTEAEAPGFVIGAIGVSLGPLLLIVGIALSGRSGERILADAEARKRKLTAQADAARANGGSGGATPQSARSTADPSAAAVGTLAAQLAAIAAARQRAGDDER